MKGRALLMILIAFPIPPRRLSVAFVGVTGITAVCLLYLAAMRGG